MNIESQRAAIQAAHQRGRLPTLVTYTKLSGPGWMQSAITLGGGSLAGSLYLGVLAGYQMMWLQPLAMVLGIVMLSAMAYVTLSTGRRPLSMINQEVNPVLGWGWAIATLLANLVWCLPQFALGSAALRQNLLPGLLGPDAMSETTGICVSVALMALGAAAAVWFYESGGRGAKTFEWVLKILVAVIICCFLGVVIKLSGSEGGIDWRSVLSGFWPQPRLMLQPADAYTSFLEAAGQYGGFWSERIIGQQRDVLITAAATAVGVNMTFLLPYSLLDRGWDRDFRGLAVFDLSIGLFIPFLLVTGCVVIASAARFHARGNADLVAGTPVTQEQLVQAASPNIASNYLRELDARLVEEYGKQVVSGWTHEELAARRAELPMADRQLAAMLVKRDAFDLARSLEPLTGPEFSHYVFGIGVVAMTLSSIIVLMLINGFVVCEMLGRPSGGTLHAVGAAMPLAIGVLGPFVMRGKAMFWLAVPTSIFGMILLPIAYGAFLFLMNHRNVLRDDLPRGGRRVAVNIAMGVAVALATFGAGWSIWTRTQAIFGIQIRWIAIGVLALFLLAAWTCRRVSRQA